MRQLAEDFLNDPDLKDYTRIWELDRYDVLHNRREFFALCVEDFPERDGGATRPGRKDIDINNNDSDAEPSFGLAARAALRHGARPGMNGSEGEAECEELGVETRRSFQETEADRETGRRVRAAASVANPASHFSSTTGMCHCDGLDSYTT